IPPNANVFIHGGACTPRILIEEMVKQNERLQECALYHLHTEGPVPYVRTKSGLGFKIRNLFVGANMRRHLDYSQVDYLPCFLSEIPALFRSRQVPLDVALLHVSSP